MAPTVREVKTTVTVGNTGDLLGVQIVLITGSARGIALF